MRVLACGDRNWTDRQMVFSTLSQVFKVAERDPEFVLIEGQAKGADKIAGEWAEMMAKYGVAHEMYPANWQMYGRGAGPVRNQQMLDEGRPDLVVAFHDAITESKGTKDMVTRAEKSGVRIWLVRHEDSLI